MNRKRVEEDVNEEEVEEEKQQQGEGEWEWRGVGGRKKVAKINGWSREERIIRGGVNKIMVIMMKKKSRRRLVQENIKTGRYEIVFFQYWV